MQDSDVKKILLGEPVSVTLPAHIWVGFFSAYASTDWNNYCASAIATECQKAVLEPRFIKEQEARAQHNLDMQQGWMQRLISGTPPEVPPTIGEPE